MIFVQDSFFYRDFGDLRLVGFGFAIIGLSCDLGMFAWGRRATRTAAV